MASHRRAGTLAKTVPMHLIAIAWLYVALMAAVVEATSSQGSVLGALFTFVGYGVLPLSIVLYVLRSPIRRAAQRAADAAADPQSTTVPARPLTLTLSSEGRGNNSAPSPDAQGLDPDGGRHAPGHAVTPERKEP
jgi:hypothetical protein